MNTPLTLLAICACALSLNACDKAQTTPPPAVVAMPATTAASVYPPINAAKADPTVAQTDGTRKPAQESKEVPMPGQNNDHSAPLGPAKPASAP